MKWTLANAEERNQKNPKTFDIPTREKRDGLQVGDVVKLLFEFDRLPNGCNGERMWVKIVDVIRPGHYSGLLDSHPAFLTSLKMGDRVEFAAEHIASIYERTF